MLFLSGRPTFLPTMYPIELSTSARAISASTPASSVTRPSGVVMSHS